MAEPDFWNDIEKAQEIAKTFSILKEKVAKVEAVSEDIIEQEVLLEIYQEEQNNEILQEVRQKSVSTAQKLKTLRLAVLLGGEYDSYDVIMSIHPGAGGTESQDWAEMLLRMYLRYFEKKSFAVETLDIQPADEAGIKSVTLLIKGPYAYGYLKGEKGVHRLVRISPFDSSGRRHTSFASVDVIPDVNDELDLDLDPNDLRIETYRASGAGGQHVNKTDSAVRITHLPTNIMVQCQNERSQHRNKDVALRILKSKLLEKEKLEQEKKIDGIRGEQKEIAWGSQIRSYVFHPYSLVKDLRNNYEIGNVNSVMDGGLDPLISAYLQWKSEGGDSN